ncbi:receptor-like protein EIX2 [Apium graveolens]|uniref:receptor-like protein EIX2 n=1 Tax=Apium graveolens TaxID=4045 RepID=UPI003D7A7497
MIMPFGFDSVSEHSSRMTEESKITGDSKCIEIERQALLEIKRDLVDLYGVLSTWGSEQDCCQWRRVGCHNRTGHVTHLHLSAIHYRSFDDQVPSSISASLLHLKNLNYLDLSSNDFGGHSIPNFIGSLANLVYLDLSQANYGGAIPPELGSLSKLNHLDLSYNNFDSIPHELGNLSNLIHLDLSSSLHGSFPVPMFIGSLTSLTYLGLSNNQFSGVFSNQLTNLSKLNHLELGDNYFDSSPIPKFIASFTSLRYLDLSRSHFTGEVPHQLANLSNLQHLGLGYSGVLEGGIFSWLFNLSSLTELDLSGIDIGTANDWITLTQRLPLLSFLQLNRCKLTYNISASFSTNMSSPISTLYLRHNFISSSIFGWLSNFSDSLVSLDLGNNQLRGEIPESFGRMTLISSLELHGNQLQGAVPNSFRNLSSLQYIDFSSNRLTGDLHDLLNVFAEDTLRNLFIDDNQITGSLPDLTQFSSLQSLNVRSNKMNGYLPKHFQHNSVLYSLDLSYNSLTGSLPNFTGLSSLSDLYLNDNNFFGSLPDFTGCSSLYSLVLSGNQFTEWETPSIGQLANLRLLDVSTNSIRSTISETHLSNLSNLVEINASYNSLTFDISSEWFPPFQLSTLSLASCKLGPKFPKWIRDQKSLYILDFSNSQISDIIPMWFWNVSSTLESLDLSSNKIRGKFSSGNFNFKVIDLSSNYFEGPVPNIPSQCSEINLSQNKFSGTPFSLAVVKDVSLSFLDLSHNVLSGSLPDAWVHFKDLVFLNLGYNNFSGRIPMSMGILVSVQTLILRRNSFSGELPASLRNCTNLGFIDFGLNRLSGKVPAWIGEDLLNLYALILRSNKFHGSTPYQLCHLSNLYFLDLSINQISGILPQCFGNLTSMTKKGTEITEHYYNSTNALAPTSSFVDTALAGWKGQEFEYGRNFVYLKMIDLSSNQMTGEIPIGITGLLDVKGLNLSRNNFYGIVPLDIGRLKMLESLDLSRNSFSGKIPQSMSGLYFLGYLDLSNNNFSGRIPSGTQLQGFNSSAYEGNLGLCGPPVTKRCPGDEADDEDKPTLIDNESDADETEYTRWLYISAALGFSTSFWGICGSLLLNRRWRHAYFLFLKKLKDQIFLMAFCIARIRR